ncbi:MAG: hypothetical protein MKZ61_05370, partial [Flavobacteriales bacterium]|nr:hypothetical protein [Flavobacteriales bacterium]
MWSLYTAMDWYIGQSLIVSEKPCNDLEVGGYEVGLGIFFLKFDLLHRQLILEVAEAHWCLHLAVLQESQLKVLKFTTIGSIDQNA